MSESFDRRSAWMAKQQEIEDFILRDVTRPEVAYLQSAHASGKSTTMLQHIMRLIGKTLPQTSETPLLVYVLPRPLEANMVTTYLQSTESNEGISSLLKHTGSSPKSPYTILCYENFLFYLNKNGKSWPNGMVIIADVELRPSVWGEIFFGKLVELVRGDKHTKHAIATKVLLMSPHRSPRTIEAFSKVVGRVQEIVVPDINPRLHVELLPIDNWMEKAAPLIEQVLEGDEEAMVIVGNNFDYLSKGLAAYNPYPVGSLSTVNCTSPFPSEARVLAVDPEGGVLAHTKGLRLMILQYTARSVEFDVLTRQLVEYERVLSKKELELLNSWALKTTSNHDDVAIYMASAENQNLMSANDLLGPAWNVDLSWLILAIFSTWPDFSLPDLPLRRQLNLVAFDDMLRKLRIMGLLTEDHERISITSLGKDTLKRIENSATLIPTRYQLQLHSAYLLTSALAAYQKREISLKVFRVLIRIAVITTAGISTFCRLNMGGDQTRPSLPAIRNQCEGVGKKQHWRGAIWVALGIYTKGCANDDFQADSPEWTAQGCIGVNLKRGYYIMKAIEKIEREWPLIPSTNEIRDTLLNDEELATVDKHLVQAWLHRVVGIHYKTVPGRFFDVVSNHQVQIEAATDLFDVEAAAMAKGSRKAGGMFAIYDRLVRGPGDVLKAQNLTFIPEEYIYQVESKIGAPGPLPF